MPLSFDLGDFDPGADFAGECVAGENLRLTDEGRSLRGSLRDMREDARRIERKADEGDLEEGGWPAARSIWKDVRDHSLDVLKNRSHDLEFASFCIEALARTDGFIGLAMGFEMVREMVERQWPSLYPVPDPEDGPVDDAATAEEKILPIQRLVGLDSEGLLIPALLRIPLTESRDGQEFGLCHWRSSRELVGESDEEKLALAIERGGTTPKQFEEAIQVTSPAFLKESFQELNEAAESWERLSEAVATASQGLAVLPAGPLRELFEEGAAAYRVFAPATTAEETPQDEDREQQDETGAAGGGEIGVSTAVGRIRTRSEAFEQLEKIASFFESHDPHSLIAAHLRSVVRLGRLPREDYYRQLLKDESALSILFNAVGIDPSPNSDYG
jgi:type VI secretion system protein ImpA